MSGADPSDGTSGDAGGANADDRDDGRADRSDGARAADQGTDARADADRRDRPDWDDAYLQAVAGRLAHNYDLERDETVAGRRFGMYGELLVQREKHFLHPALSFGYHESREHLFVDRRDGVGVADLERLVELGHELADRWVEPDEEHYSTDFSFVVVVPSIPDDVRAFVEGFEDRTLLKYGYHGHYEINLVVAAPAAEEVAASERADVAEAFRTWDPIETDELGVLGLIARRLQL